uniref:Uncharacterized protein n=1 Tax=Acrobeloides nanus TaxID=290746 RepID=A0A914D1T6_9BILA
MGDHGPRYGKLRDTKVGMFEDNNPSMFFVVPEKIRANKEIMWTLQTNSNQLLSHYDLYATLVDIVRRSDPFQANKKLILHGTSFLEPLPQPRNCVDLKIPIEYCQCEFNKVSKSNDIMLTRSLAKFMVFTINEKIRQHNYSHLCAFLKLDPRASVEVEEFEPGSGLNIYQVTVQVQPGGGRFWGYFHAKYDKYGKPSYELISESMPRLNTYGGQECPDLHPMITFYCYCRNEKNHFVDPKLGHRIDSYTYVNLTL